MKHTEKIIGNCLVISMLVCVYCIVRADAVSNWFQSNIAKPFERDVIKPFERDVIKPTEQTFIQLGKDIEKGMKSLSALLEKRVIAPIVSAGDSIFAKFKNCGAVVAIGSEWAAKKAAYETAQAALVVANEMNEMGPVEYGIYIAKQAALLGLDAVILRADDLARIMTGVGTIIGGGFNITEVLFDMQATDLEQGKLPLFQVKGIFIGKPVQLTFQFDVKNPEKSMASIIKELVKLVPIV